MCVTSLFCPMLARAHESESNRMLTADDLTATGVIVNKQFLKVSYSPFKAALINILTSTWIKHIVACSDKHGDNYHSTLFSLSNAF